MALLAKSNLDDGTSPSSAMKSQITPMGGRCDRCRTGHNKCDGATPACGLCVKRGRECSYERAAGLAARATPKSAKKVNGAPKTATETVTATAVTTAAAAVGQSCLPCRKAKRRCDQERPVCGPCAKRERECVYGSTLKRPRSGQIFGSSTGIQSSPAISENNSGRPRKQRRLSPPPSNPVRQQPSASMEGGNSSVQRGRTSTSVISSMRDASSSISDNESERSEKQKQPEPASSPPRRPQMVQRFFTPQAHLEETKEGESSVQLASNRHREESDDEMDEDPSPFMAGLKQAILQRTDTSKPGTTHDSENELERLDSQRKDNASLKTTTAAPDPKDMELPVQDRADHLISDYLTREYVNLPIFNLTSFQTKYRAIWTEEDVPEDMGVFRATLNIMFALVSLALVPNNRNEASMYFTRAQNILRIGGLEGEDIAHVQAYILASQYLLAVNNMSAAWKSIGIAISTAQSLRLHLNSGWHHHRNRKDRELGKRLWHSCIIVQRTVAMNMGSRPQVTPQAFKTPLPAPLEDEYIDTIFGGKPEDGSDRPSIIEFFAAMARLCERYDDIVAIQDELRLARGRYPRKVLDCFDSKTILEADRLLSNWKIALPPYLQPENEDHPSLKNPIARRQHNIIRIRYLHMRLLLWRPFLTLNASSPGLSPFAPAENDESPFQHSIDVPFSHTLVHEGAIKCIIAARELVDLITTGKSQSLEPVTPWWENIGYAFSCATVFIAARLCPESVFEELPEDEFVEQGWRRSVKLLDGYCEFSPVASKCVAALDDITEAALDDDGQEVSEEEGGKKQIVRDVSWLECLPADLAE